MKKIKLIVSSKFMVKVLIKMIDDLKLFCYIKIDGEDQCIMIKKIDTMSKTIVCEFNGKDKEISMERVTAINIKSDIPTFIIGDEL